MNLMRQTFRFVVALVLGLGLLAWLASIIVQRTTRDWFQKDTILRAQLVINGARQALSEHWSKKHRKDLQNTLVEITRDERIMAAAACGADLTLLASTADFPPEFSCRQVGHHVRATSDASLETWSAWHQSTSLPGGSVLVSAIPIQDSGQPLGFVVLVHDLSYAERREARTQQFLVIAFVILAVAASAVTIFTERVSWRGWIEEIRRLARGVALRGPEFEPILGDVRELVDRVMVEK